MRFIVSLLGVASADRPEKGQEGSVGAKQGSASGDGIEGV